MDYVGIDLHKKQSQICILSGGGQLSECRLRTAPQRFAEVLGGRPRARILLEASTESEWVAHAGGLMSYGPNLPADADREWRCYRAGARGLLLQPLLDGGTLLLDIEGLGPAVRALRTPRHPVGRS